MRWRYLKLDLPYLFGELVIVVAGVAIALVANGAYEDWKEGRVEASYLQRIGADLENGFTRLNTKVRRNVQSRDGALRLIDLLEQESPTSMMSSLDSCTRRRLAEPLRLLATMRRSTSSFLLEI